MKVMIRGKGARERALGRKVGGNGDIVCSAPGNFGFQDSYPDIGTGWNDIPTAIAFAKKEAIDLVICGPEGPPCMGEADAFAEAGMLYCGPKKQAAMATEGSKVSFKRLLAKHGIRTAPFCVYGYAGINDGLVPGGFISRRGVENIVVKADGLFAGKGVFTPTTVQELLDGCSLLWKKDPVSASRFVVEDKLPGPEYSVMGLTDGQRFLPFPDTQDAKKRTNDPKSPNTGGMGAYTCAMPPHLQAEAYKMIQQIIDALRAEGIEYRGFIYVGFMVGADGLLYVLECNCRLGDPETQALLFSMQFDLAYGCKQAALGDLSMVRVPEKICEAVSVVMAAPDYPGTSHLDVPIWGTNKVLEMPGVFVFHGSTARKNDLLMTDNGGRILNVTATAPTLKEAHYKAYEAVSMIDFEGVEDMTTCYRQDIAAAAIAD